MAYYRLLALDIDGTLVGPDQVVPPDVVEAIAEADRSGLRVCLATGRSYAESIGVWRQLRLSPPYEPMVLIGGALVSEPDTGRTLYQNPIPQETAWRFADALAAHSCAAMAIVDGWRYDVDYYLAETGDVDAASRDWFAKMDVRVRRVRRLADVADMPEPLRISAVAEAAKARAMAAELSGRFAGRLNVHAILAPNYGVTVVEAHAAGAHKLAGVLYVAQARRIGRGRIAVVGDDINDLPMVRGAGLGAAMPEAPESLRRAAAVVASDGLADFIRRLAAGGFDARRADGDAASDGRPTWT